MPDDKALVCLAQVAPGQTPAARSKWCVNPSLCRGYGAHAWTDALSKLFGKRSDTFSYTEGYQRPENAVVLVAPQWQQGAAPEVPWRVPDTAWDKDTGELNKRPREEGGTEKVQAGAAAAEAEAAAAASLAPGMVKAPKAAAVKARAVAASLLAGGGDSKSP